MEDSIFLDESSCSYMISFVSKRQEEIMRSIFAVLFIFLSIHMMSCCVLDPCGCNGSNCSSNPNMSGDAGALHDTNVPCTTIPQSPVILGVNPTGQVCQSWCWAASITMVVNYLGNPIPLCKAPTDKQWQTRGVNGFNCCSYAACSTQCNQTATVQEMKWHLNNEGIASTLLNRKLSETELQLELSNNRPVIVGYLSSFFGHVVVVTGFAPGSPSLYRVADPFYGVFDVTYDQLCCKYKNGTAYWGQTFYRLSYSLLPAQIPNMCTQ